MQPSTLVAKAVSKGAGMPEAPIYSAKRPYEIAWVPGGGNEPHAGRVKVGPHPAPWVSQWPGKGAFTCSVGHSDSGWPTKPTEEREKLAATALDLLMNGVSPQELLRELWKIEQWRELRLPLSACLFLDDGTWSPHNCDSQSPPHNLRAKD